jgi:hypothetical protein
LGYFGDYHKPLSRFQATSEIAAAQRLADIGNSEGTIEFYHYDRLKPLRSRTEDSLQVHSRNHASASLYLLTKMNQIIAEASPMKRINIHL